MKESRQFVSDKLSGFFVFCQKLKYLHPLKVIFQNILAVGHNKTLGNRWEGDERRHVQILYLFFLLARLGVIDPNELNEPP